MFVELKESCRLTRCFYFILACFKIMYIYIYAIFNLFVSLFQKLKVY